MVSLAHKFAFESPQVWADGVSSVQLPELAGAYGVLGTPHTILAPRQSEMAASARQEGPEHLRGKVSEARLLAAILEAHKRQ